MMIDKLEASLLFALILLSPLAAGAEDATSPVGREVQEFTLDDYRGAEHSLSDFKQSKLLVLAYLGTECPLAKLYTPRLVQLSQKYKDRGVTVIGINANCHDSITEIAAHARIHQAKFPILKDAGNRLADQMGAIRTPEVFLLDQQRVVRYWGRIDDQYGIGYVRDEPKRHDLRIAIDELLAGKSVSTPMSKSVGCHIGRIQEPDPHAEVTYSNQIARLLQKRCVECHRPGEIAPFSLTDYDEVVGWARMMAEVVREERMPPWHADPQWGKFAGERRLSDKEKQLVFDWVKAGAPEGDKSKLPPPREFTSGWQLSRKPDLVVSMRQEPFKVPAEGVVKYQYFRAKANFEEDRWVTAADVQPGNRAVVHHILVFARGGPGSVVAEGGKFLAAYVPGLRTQPFPKGMAKRIPAGAELIFQVHYTPIGSEQLDLSRVGFVFADPKEITHQVVTMNAIQRRLDIPPHAENHAVQSRSQVAGEEVLLLAMMPHMHLRGRSFRYEAHYADGRVERLLDVPNYDFNWQTGYRLAQPKRLPKGTHIQCLAHFDNSERNLANPDPTQTVHWGDQTWDEMMIGYFDIALPVNAKKPVAERPAVRERLRKAAEKLIARFDKNKNSHIDRDEVPEKLKKLFDRLDQDEDGKLTLEELRPLVREQEGE